MCLHVVCVYGQVHSYIRVHTHMSVVCRAQRSTLGSFSQLFSTLLLETGSLTVTGVHGFGQTGWQSDPESWN